MDMNIIFTLGALSVVIWFVIDRFMPSWADKSWGKYVTLAVSVVLGELAAILVYISSGYTCDILNAFGISIPWFGAILTGLVMSAGASAVYEVVDAIKALGTKNKEQAARLEEDAKAEESKTDKVDLKE